MKRKFVGAVLAVLSLGVFAAPTVATAQEAPPDLLHISLGNTNGPGCTPLNLVVLKLYLCL